MPNDAREIFNQSHCNVRGKYSVHTKTMDCCRCCRRIVEKNHFIDLFGVKSRKEGIVEAVRGYGNINVKEEDIGIASTKICRTCYHLVSSIKEKVEKFSKICKGSREEDDFVVEKTDKRTVDMRSPSQATVSPSALPQVKRSKPHEKKLGADVRVSLFSQQRPILPRPQVLQEDTSKENTEVILYYL